MASEIWGTLNKTKSSSSLASFIKVLRKQRVRNKALVAF